MEPIAAGHSSLAVRPSGAALQPELTAVLREGRILAGEVLRNLSDGGVLIGIGRHRVPAQTDLRLEAGTRFVFQVELQGEALLLRVLGTGAEGESSFLRLLRAVIGEDRPMGEILSALAAEIRAALARPDAARDELARLLAALRAHVHDPARGAGGGDALARALSGSGLGYEARLLAAALAGRPDPALLEALSGDLKAGLLRALGELPAGPLREAVARALAAIEAEQLLNLARAHAGEPQVWSLPLPDGDGWTTARLAVHPRREDGEGGGEREGEEEEPARLVLGVSFTATGPVRADLALSERLLGVRLVVVRADVARRLEADAAELQRRLGDGRREVRLHVRAGSAEEAEVAARPLDIQLLREHRLLDVAG